MTASADSPSPGAPGAGQSAPGGADPSMEDILASIRRILSEEDAVAAAAPAAQSSEEDVFVLDPSMMIPEQTPVPSDLPPSADRAELPAAETVSPLVAPAAAAAAASSVGSLVKTLSARNAQVFSGGPTLEDMVRDEIRPLLKSWLDTNLAPMVERLVRAEIERVVGRADH